MLYHTMCTVVLSSHELQRDNLMEGTIYVLFV